MKRIAQLRGLSDDHHTALVIALRCRRSEPAAHAELWEAVRDSVATHFEPHFAIEEQHLLPELERLGEGALAARIRADHERLRALTAQAQPDAERVREFGRLLDAHVRYEEREVFEPTQDRIAPAVLDAIEEACARVPRVCAAALVGGAPSLEIRAAGERDADALVVLIAGFRDHLAARTPTDAELRESVPRALAARDVEFRIGWRDGAAVGYTQTRFLDSVWVQGGDAYLEDLFVVESARGTGVGRGLLRDAIARARARGARRIGLLANSRNETAQALYRSEGLRPDTAPLYPGGHHVHWVRALGDG